MTPARLLSTETSNSPLYMQMAKTLRTQIMEGRIKGGEALPSERDLSVMMKASRVTVRKATELLIEEGLLSRRQGSGTFVSPRIQAPGSFLTSFSEDAETRGDVAETRWISKTVDTPTDEEMRLLDLKSSDQVVRLNRVRLIGGEALAIENAVVPMAMLPDHDALEGSLYAALFAHGNRPLTGNQKIRAASASPEEAELLGISQGTEILRIERLTRRADGRPVELTRSAYRGDRYEFVSELRGALVVL